MLIPEQHSSYSYIPMDPAEPNLWADCSWKSGAHSNQPSLKLEQNPRENDPNNYRYEAKGRGRWDHDAGDEDRASFLQVYQQRVVNHSSHPPSSHDYWSTESQKICISFSELIWQWKITIFNGKYIFKWLFFHYYIKANTSWGAVQVLNVHESSRYNPKTTN